MTLKRITLICALIAVACIYAGCATLPDGENLDRCDQARSAVKVAVPIYGAALSAVDPARKLVTMWCGSSIVDPEKCQSAERGREIAELVLATAKVGLDVAVAWVMIFCPEDDVLEHLPSGYLYDRSNVPAEIVRAEAR